MQRTSSKRKWFVETYAQHAARLGKTARQVKIHRILLQHKRSGVTDLNWIEQDMGTSNCPTEALVKSIAELEAFLRVVYNPATQMYFSDGYQASEAAVVLAASLQELSREGNKQARAQAGLHNGLPPYGYREGRRVTVTCGKQRFVGYRLEITEPQAQTVNAIFAAVIAGTPLSEIARELNIQGIPAADGRWSGDKIRDVLRRAPFYAGYVVYRSEEYKNDRWRGTLYPARYYEPLFEWDTVEAMLDVQGRECLWEFGE